jgi:hypothetical protein
MWSWSHIGRCSHSCTGLQNEYHPDTKPRRQICMQSRTHALTHARTHALTRALAHMSRAHAPAWYSQHLRYGTLISIRPSTDPDQTNTSCCCSFEHSSTPTSRQRSRRYLQRQAKPTPCAFGNYTRYWDGPPGPRAHARTSVDGRAGFLHVATRHNITTCEAGVCYRSEDSSEASSE